MPVISGVAAIRGNSGAWPLGETFPGHRVASNADRARDLVAIFFMFDLSPLDLVGALRKRGNPIPAVLLTGDPNRRVRDRAAAADVPVIAKLIFALTISWIRPTKSSAKFH